MDQLAGLPDRVTHVQVEDRDVYLVGTAHLSSQSLADVRATVEQVRPQAICVELCQARHQAMTQADNWRKMDIFKVIRQKKAVFLLAQLIMSSFYRRLGAKLGVQPGAEMLEGVRLAEQTGARLVLADRDIEITLRRVWGYLGFWSKLKLTLQLMMGILFHEEIDAEMIEQLKRQDQLETVMAEFAQRFPQIKSRLIDERDLFLAEKIRTAPGRTVVAVVGAGHVEGITRELKGSSKLEVGSLKPGNLTLETCSSLEASNLRLQALLELPPKSLWPTLAKWGVPVLILGLLAYGFTKGTAHGFQNIYIWILVTGLLAGAGAALALAHPLAILSAFLAAPIATLHPLIAAGWVAGLVQAIVKKPKVSDLEDLPQAIATLKGFWTNPVTRILLIVALANLGSMIGFYVAGLWIGARSV